jgi:threonine aldolase
MVYALDHHVERLAEDHTRARRLAEGLAAAGAPVNADAVETNFIGLDIGSLGLTVREAQELIAREGVLVGGLRPGVVRIATYLGVTDDDVEAAIDAIPRALQEHIANGRSATATATAIPRDR